MNTVTMKDIARLAGVSRPVVSVVLGNKTGSTKVSREKREKILKIAEELCFVPNLAAKELAGAKSHVIGVITSAYLSGMNSKLQTIVTLELYAKGYDVFTLPGPRLGNDSDAQIIIDKFRMRNVEGIISLAYPQRTRKLAEKCGVPYIELGCDFSIPNLSDFAFDIELGGEMAANHLIQEHGRKKICFLSGERFSVRGAATLKFSGMRKAMNNAGIPCPDSAFIDFTNYSIDDLFRNLREAKADAVLACNDFCAARFVRAAVHRGIRIPDDIAVIGFDGDSICDCSLISLATIQQSQGVLARHGINALSERITSSSLNETYEVKWIPPVFSPGESCGCHGCTEDFLCAEDMTYLYNITGCKGVMRAPFSKFRNYWQIHEHEKKNNESSEE